MEPMRITYHNGRSGSAKHNDRTFDLDKAEHIDQHQTENNRYYTWLDLIDDTTERSFEEAEEIFYERYFTKGLAARNDRYLKNRHPERVKSMKEYMKAYQTKPEETLIYVGSKGNSVEDPDLLLDIYSDYLVWRSEAYPQLAFLDVSFHLDEATLHIHERSVWIGHDTDGNEIPGQNKALAEMGVERPDMTKPEGRYNNAKMTFTADCRSHLQDICRAHGIEIEDHPRERSERGLSLIEYKAQQEEKKLSETIRENTRIKAESKQTLSLIDEINRDRAEAQKELQQARIIREYASEREERMTAFFSSITPYEDSGITMMDCFENCDKELLNHRIDALEEEAEEPVISEDIDITDE